MSVVRNKVVLVTGGAGFVGSALIRELLKSGAKVISYDNYFHGTIRNIEGLEEFSHSGQFIAVEGDVFEQSMLEEKIRSYDVEFVINCIGDPFIPATDHYAERCHHINAEGTLSVLQVVKESNIKRLVHISSCEVHGLNNVPALAETDRLNPCSKYAMSKYRAERHCSEFLPSLQGKGEATPLVVARLFNCYGPRATHPYIIPEIIRQLHHNNVLQLGNLTERDFTYVHDTARAIVALLTAQIPPMHEDSSEQLEVVNIGSGTSYSIGRLARELARIMEIPELRILTNDSVQRLNDIPRFVCSNKRLHKYTDWTPEVNLEEGLRKTVSWFKKHDSHWNFSKND